MTVRMIPLPDGRILGIGPLEPLDSPVHRPFAVLVPAFDADERARVELITSSLIAHGCVEFCCVGPQAGELHDAIDSIIEDNGAFDVVTTGDTCVADACEYFLFAATGKSCALLALVSSHAELVARLEQVARPGDSGDREGLRMANDDLFERAMSARDDGDVPPSATPRVMSEFAFSHTRSG